MQIYSIIIDIIIVIFFLIIVVSSYKGGFVRAVILLVGTIAAYFISVYLSKMLSIIIYDNYMYAGIVQAVNEALVQGTAAIDLQGVLDAIQSSIPAALLAIIGGTGAFADALLMSQEQLVNGTGEVLVKTIISPVILHLIEIVLCVIIFVLLLFIVRILSSAFKGIRSIPIIGPINSILGGLIGAVQWGITMYLVGILVGAIIKVTNNEFELLNSTIVNSTYIFKLFYRIKVL